MTDQVKLIYVLIKQVPNMKAKAGMNADGTIDRAAAKAMLNPFDSYAIQAGLDLKKVTGATLVAITMGPPRAEDVLREAMEYGVDKGALLTDRRLAGSDTLATAYALSKCVEALGKPDVVLCGLQTTDGDTAHVGPQVAERLGYPQITYVESFELKDGAMHARRIIEGGHQNVKCTLPVLMTVANACKPLGKRSFKDVARVKKLFSSDEKKAEVVQIIDLDFCEADFNRTGLDGSPTIVSKTQKIGEKGAHATMFEGDSVTAVTACLSSMSEAENYESFAKHAK